MEAEGEVWASKDSSFIAPFGRNRLGKRKTDPRSKGGRGRHWWSSESCLSLMLWSLWEWSGFGFSDWEKEKELALKCWRRKKKLWVGIEKRCGDLWGEVKRLLATSCHWSEVPINEAQISNFFNFLICCSYSQKKRKEKTQICPLLVNETSGNVENCSVR